MLNRWLHGCAVALCVLAGPAIADDAAVPPDLQGVWQSFRTAVETGDAEAVAGLSNFPVTANDFGGTVKSKADLKKRFDRIFPTEVKACFAEARPMRVATYRDPVVICDGYLVFGFRKGRDGYRFAYVENANGE